MDFRCSAIGRSFAYYVMAIGYLLTGSLLLSYYLLFVTIFAVGYIGFCLIANREQRFFLYRDRHLLFLLLDNVRLMFGEGNLARAFMSGMLPLFLLFLYESDRKEKIFDSDSDHGIFVCCDSYHVDCYVCHYFSLYSILPEQKRNMVFRPFSTFCTGNPDFRDRSPASAFG